MKLFLEARDLLDHIQLTTDRYLVVRDEWLDGLSQYVVNDLRSQWYIVQRQLTVIKRAKAFAYAEKQWYTHVVLVGDEVQLKELATGDMTVLQYDM
jgi:histidyl-tRNA synthetase